MSVIHIRFNEKSIAISPSFRERKLLEQLQAMVPPSIVEVPPFGGTSDQLFELIHREVYGDST